MSPNYNYLRGRRAEWRACKDLERNGFVALRTAGSHGFADVIGVQVGAPVQLIQVKTVSSKAKADKLIKRFVEHPPTEFSVYYEQAIWVWVLRHGW